MEATLDAGTEATALADAKSEHQHDVQWWVSKYEPKPKATRIWVEMSINCGCELHAVEGETIADDNAHFGQFVSEMQDQLGWEIHYPSGWSSHTSYDDSGLLRSKTFHVRVRRTSLTEAHQR